MYLKVTWLIVLTLVLECLNDPAPRRSGNLKLQGRRKIPGRRQKDKHLGKHLGISLTQGEDLSEDDYFEGTTDTYTDGYKDMELQRGTDGWIARDFSGTRSQDSSDGKGVETVEDYELDISTDCDANCVELKEMQRRIRRMEKGMRRANINFRKFNRRLSFLERLHKQQSRLRQRLPSTKYYRNKMARYNKPVRRRCWTCQVLDCDTKCVMKMGDERMVQYPFTVVVDHTLSQEQARDLIISTIKSMNIHKAKMYQLVTFNDNDIQTKIYPASTQYKTFINELEDVRFIKGGDANERTFDGLLKACLSSLNGPLIVVTTDHGSKELELENAIKGCLERKKATVMFVIMPTCKVGPRCPPLKKSDHIIRNASMAAYNRLASINGGSVINHDQVQTTIQKLERELKEKIFIHSRGDCTCTSGYDYY